MYTNTKEKPEEPKGIGAKLLKVQQKLRVPKDRKNNFGGYTFRNASDILEAVKPYLEEVGAFLALTDTVKAIGEGANARFYVVATARFASEGSDAFIQTEGWAREEVAKKGMDAAQLTGACSSYARKYALCGLFAIDDSRLDPDEGNGGQRGGAASNGAEGKAPPTNGGGAAQPNRQPTANKAVSAAEGTRNPTTATATTAAAQTEDALTATRREAWRLFCQTEVGKKSDENARSKFFFQYVMKTTGALNPKTIPLEGWEKVVNALKQY